MYYPAYFPVDEALRDSLPGKQLLPFGALDILLFLWFFRLLTANMSSHLSSLPLSGQNSRAHTPTSVRSSPKKSPLTEKRIMADDRQGTLGSSPLRHELVNTDRSSHQDVSYASARELPDGPQNDDSKNIPSSPFHNEVRDDTLPPQKLEQVQSNAGVEDPTTRKRSLDDGPMSDGTDAGHLPDDKRTKSDNAAAEITVYSDPDGSAVHEESTTPNTNPEGANTADEHHEDSALQPEDYASENKENMKSGADDDETDDFHDPMDDTGLSTFSAVPTLDMTSFANLRGNSPFKAQSRTGSPAKSPGRHSVEPETPITVKPYKSALLDVSSPTSPTPRGKAQRDSIGPDETLNLLEFTGQISLPPRPRYSMQGGRHYLTRQTPSKSFRSPNKGSLLDLDVSPAPTPSSVPTVSTRQLEQLKSDYVSEISSLQATLTGKQAEILSLQQAMADTEKQIGEAMEEARKEAARRESIERERSEDERKNREMAESLENSKRDMLHSEKEKERLLMRMDEMEKGRDKLEERNVQLESQLTAARESRTGADGDSGEGMITNEALNRIVRDLHRLYKGKHENKIGQLKRSYEGRWGTRVQDIEARLKAADEENARLRTMQSASSVPNPDSSILAHERFSIVNHERDEYESEKRVMEARINGLQQEIATLKNDSQKIRLDLQTERAEKGELVTAVDEWLAMQDPQPTQTPQPTKSSSESPTTRENEQPQPKSPATQTPAANLKRSFARSGIRPPGSHTGEGKFPRIGGVGGRGSHAGRSGIAVYTPGKPGIMGSIERMGRGGA